MCKYISKLVTIACFVLVFPIISMGQDTSTNEDYPTDIKKYDFSFMGSTSKISPRIVIRMDNNWEILLACLSEKTKAELNGMDIDFTDSQLMLLHVMRLMEVEGDRLKTTMPILGSVKMTSLREKMRNLAVKFEPEMRGGVDDLKAELKKIGRQANMYTILFSYVLDHLAWVPFFKRDLIKITGFTAEKPFWAGVFWACYPPREFTCGTSSWDKKEVSFKINTNDGTLEKLFKPFSITNLETLYRDYIKYGKIVNESLLNELAPYEIFDSYGNLTVPIIEEQEDKPLYQKCQSVAIKVAQLFLDNVDVNSLMEEYEFYDAEKAIVVSYHEWMWEYLAFLEEKGIIKKPFAFSNPKEAGPKDIGALLFVVKRYSEQ